MSLEYKEGRRPKDEVRSRNIAARNLTRHEKRALRLMTSESYNPSTRTESRLRSYTGSERRTGIERRQTQTSEQSLDRGERRTRVRRKVDRLMLEATALRAGGRSYRRIRIETPVFYRPIEYKSVPNQLARRGVTHTLATGGLGMLLEEELRVGMPVEVLISFGGDLLAVDVEVVSVLHQGGRFLHGCRFMRLGEADSQWLNEYLRNRDAPPA